MLSPLVAQQTGKTWPKTNAILEVFFSKKFDVIHYHNISLLGPDVLRMEPDYPDFIKLYTTHEHWLICPMHVLWKNNERLCDKPECFRCTLKFGRPPQWWRYTHLLEKCIAAVDTFVSPSLFTRKMHEDRGFKWPMTVVPNFVPEPDQGLSVEIRRHIHARIFSLSAASKRLKVSKHCFPFLIAIRTQICWSPAMERKMKRS